MRNELKGNPKDKECGVINLDDSDSPGTHWTAYYKSGQTKFYFDSYGNLPPPKELVLYLGEKNLYYNYDQVQGPGDPPICGHLSLTLLKELSQGVNYNEILHKIKDDRQYWKKYFI